MSGSSDYSDEEWVPYCERKEWEDVTPIEQDDGPEPIVRIAYDEKFVDVFNYFRAIYSSREVSTRALDLTTDAAELNPANYTVWHHRRFLLKELKADLRKELDYARAIIEENSKNYQVWQHRRVLIEWLNDPSAELRFCEIILAGDAKNYHAWQHRQWINLTFKLFDEELSFVDNLLTDDIRNNSAWNQRFFVVQHTAPEGKIQGEALRREVDYVEKALEKVAGNESAWNYYRGLIDRCEEEESEWIHARAKSFCDKLYDDKGIRSCYLLGAMVDLHSDQLEELSSKKEENKEAIKSNLGKAQELCGLLANDYDTIRKEYWNYNNRDLTQRFGA